MKKSIKIFLAVAMIGAISAPLTEVSAQTRKTTTAKKTTATAKKPAAKPAAKAGVKSATKAAAAAKKVDLNGYYYEGALKMEGSAGDLFSTLGFEGTEATVDFADALTLPVGYTATEATGKMTVKLSSDKVSSTLTSDDKGESFTGSLTLGRNTAKAWYVKVKKDHVVPTIEDSQLEEIVGSPDGYTAFVIGEQGGQKMCFMADAVFKAAGKSYTVTFDNATLQKVFGKMAGPYSVKDKVLTMTDEDGSTISGKVYDDGTYIMLPMPGAQGFDFSLILIR